MNKSLFSALFVFVLLLYILNTTIFASTWVYSEDTDPIDDRMYVTATSVGSEIEDGDKNKLVVGCYNQNLFVIYNVGYVPYGADHPYMIYRIDKQRALGMDIEAYSKDDIFVSRNEDDILNFVYQMIHGKKLIIESERHDKFKTKYHAFSLAGSSNALNKVIEYCGKEEGLAQVHEEVKAKLEMDKVFEIERKEIKKVLERKNKERSNLLRKEMAAMDIPVPEGDVSIQYVYSLLSSKKITNEQYDTLSDVNFSIK